eukprot:GHVT01009560.1.p1 GENE.GHVT01009560.1~~GHVT01009560.1.p1  ORF type:complete len:251 (+),score=60.05 GHVT01009560.1:289-1041(+)
MQAMQRRGCGPRTQALHQVAFQSALKYAHYTSRLPSLLKFRPIKGSTKRARSVIPFSPEEVPLLLSAAGSSMHRSLFGLGIGLGLRPSELLRVRWEDVHFSAKTLSVRGSKTKASRSSVPMTQLAHREVTSWWLEEGQPRRGLLFYREYAASKAQRSKLAEKTPIASFKKALQSAAKRAGVEVTEDGERRRTFPYLLRHSFATLAASANPPVPLPVAQAVMRHSSSKMLLETYAKAGALVIKEGLKNFKL